MGTGRGWRSRGMDSSRVFTLGTRTGGMGMAGDILVGMPGMVGCHSRRLLIGMRLVKGW